MKILVLDNYDSFTYNLVQYIERILSQRIDIYRNNKIELDEVAKYDKILLSPGPGIPTEAGIMLSLIKKYASTKSILGICLGHQAVAEAFGGTLINYHKVYHGIASETSITDKSEMLFKGVPEKFKAGRYHAWGVNKEDLPACFNITAIDDTGQIMAISHKEYDVRGVQFHPESVLTEFGNTMIENWLRY